MTDVHQSAGAGDGNPVLGSIVFFVGAHDSLIWCGEKVSSKAAELQPRSFTQHVEDMLPDTEIAGVFDLESFSGSVPWACKTDMHSNRARHVSERPQRNCSSYHRHR